MRRFLSITVLAAIILVAACGLVPAGAEELNTQAPEISTSFPAEEGWIAISEPSQWANIKKGGKYYLTNDITFGDKRYMPPEPETHDITIDGNNHTVTISQNQKALFTHATNLTMRNIFLEGDLIYQNHGGLKSPIVQWENYGPTVLTNVISNVNYIAESDVSNYITVSGIIVNAPAGSIFKKVMYTGSISIEVGAMYSSAAGLVYTAADASFVDCVNSGSIRIKGSVSIATPQRSYFSVAGICGQTTSSCEFLRCSNSGSIVHDARIYQNGGTLMGQSAVGGIVGYSYGDTFEACENTGDFSLKEAGTEASGGYVGGIVGRSERKVTLLSCTNSGDILCEESKFYIGGLVGNTKGSKIKDSTNEGDISITDKNNFVGGIQAYVLDGSADAENCSNFGNITIGENASTTSAGGIFGAVVSTDAAYESAWIENCVNKGNITASEKSDNVLMGGLLGSTVEISYFYLQYSKNTGALTNGMNRTSSATGGLVGLLSKVGMASGAEKDIIYAINNCVNEGEIYGNDRVGGIVGGVSQLMVDSVDFKIERCTNKGYVQGISAAGGILGYFNESSYRSGDNHYSSAGIEISLCENLGEVNAEKVSGGILGSTWKTEAKPEIVIASCVNFAIVGMAGSEKSGGFVGNAHALVTVKDSINCGLVKGKTVDLIGLGSVTALDNFYFAQGDAERVGAVALGIEELSVKRSNLGVLAYDRSALESLVDTAKALDKAQYSATTWIVLEDALSGAEEILKKGELELTQKEIGDGVVLLNGAISQLKPRAKLEVQTEKLTEPVAEEDGCGSAIGGTAVMISLLLLGVGYINKKKI